MTTLDQLINHLSAKQEKLPFDPTPQITIDPFPNELTYLTRQIHQLGSIFNHYKLQDLQFPTLTNAIYYCINPGQPLLPTTESTNSPTELLQELKINAIIILSNAERRKIYQTTKLPTSNPYIIIYRSLENHYYPVISLTPATNHIYYPESNQLVAKLLAPPTNSEEQSQSELDSDT